MLTTLTHTEIAEVFHNNYIGRIGFRDDDRIYITPVNYIYENDMVLCQSYEGLKVSLMRQYPQVCFEVEELRYSNDWKTVIGWGVFEELNNAADIDYARSRLWEVMLAQKAGLATPPPAQETMVHGVPHTAVVYYRIRFSELSGRMEKRI